MLLLKPTTLLPKNKQDLDWYLIGARFNIMFDDFISELDIAVKNGSVSDSEHFKVASDAMIEYVNCSTDFMDLLE